MSIITAQDTSRTAFGVRPGTRPVRARSRSHSDRTRPRVSAWHPSAPGQRPEQPSNPMTLSCLNVIDRRPSRPVSSQQTPGALQLTERALALIVIGFALAVVSGAAVVIAQYLALAG